MARWAPPDLIEKARTGEPDAVERLVATVWPSCFRLAASILGDRSLAEDVAQESCVIVLRKVCTLRVASAFDAWFYRIIMRETQRIRRRNEPVGDVYTEPIATSDDTATIDVWRSLATLAPELRDVTVLFYLDDLKSEEIANVLRVPHGTVRSRLLRARAQLRGLLGDYANEFSSVVKDVKQYAV